MKTIGLLGGMSWESTLGYYQTINKEVKRALGGLHSAKLCLYSVDFHEIEQLQHRGEWDKTAAILARGAQSLEAAGADFFLICTNTMHKVADKVASAVNIPLIHIADATAEQLQSEGVSTVGLLGTRFTMEQDFYKQRLATQFNMQVLIPNQRARNTIHEVIYNELCLGKINPDSRDFYLTEIKKLQQQGAQAVILGCTEIAMLVQPRHTDVPLFDTTAIHAQKAVSLALG